MAEVTFTGGVTDAVYQCELCGALVADTGATAVSRSLHDAWHQTVDPP